MSRRFQFSLKALLVGTGLVGGPFIWFGQNARLVHQRQVVRQSFQEIDCLREVQINGDAFYDPIHKTDRRLVEGIRPPDELPWVRRAMGDTPVKVLLYDPDDDADRRLLRARTLFPEAVIVYLGDWGRAPMTRD